MSRSFNTITREPWNPKIHNILQTIDLHVKLYLETKNEFHQNQANILRQYIADLKTWIHEVEESQK